MTSPDAQQIPVTLLRQLPKILLRNPYIKRSTQWPRQATQQVTQIKIAFSLILPHALAFYIEMISSAKNEQEELHTHYQFLQYLFYCQQLILNAQRASQSHQEPIQATTPTPTTNAPPLTGFDRWHQQVLVPFYESFLDDTEDDPQPEEEKAFRNTDTEEIRPIPKRAEVVHIRHWIQQQGNSQGTTPTPSASSSIAPLLLPTECPADYKGFDVATKDQHPLPKKYSKPLLQRWSVRFGLLALGIGAIVLTGGIAAGAAALAGTALIATSLITSKIAAGAMIAGSAAVLFKAGSHLDQQNKKSGVNPKISTTAIGPRYRTVSDNVRLKTMYAIWERERTDEIGPIPDKFNPVTSHKTTADIMIEILEHYPEELLTIDVDYEFRDFLLELKSRGIITHRAIPTEDEYCTVADNSVTWG